MPLKALKTRPRRHGLPGDDDQQSVIAGNALDRRFSANAANRKWVAAFTRITRFLDANTPANSSRG